VTKILIGAGFLLALALISPPAMAADVHMLTMSGRNLSSEGADSLEEKLVADPTDMVSRARLLGYYSRDMFRSKSAREAKGRHVLWLIENMPEAEVLGIPAGQLNALLDAKVYLEGKKLWLEHIEKSPGNLAILGNAASFFLLRDRTLAEEFLLKARSLDPKNAEWAQELGHLYSLGMMGVPAEARKELAAKALEQFETAYDLTPDMTRSFMLQELAKAAIEAEEAEKANEYAHKMLASGGKDWNSGNNIHHGNIILGRIALREGDIENARRHLLAAGKTTGSPQLNSFGPNMTLAKELLEAGEKDAVLEYFDLCSRFWKMHRGRLDAWSATVKGGGIPEFGANLAY